MIAVIIRIAGPRISIQRTSYATAVAFGFMWTAILVQKSYWCGARLCLFTHGVVISQLISTLVTFLVGTMPMKLHSRCARRRPSRAHACSPPERCKCIAEPACAGRLVVFFFDLHHRPLGGAVCLSLPANYRCKHSVYSH